eukprot:GILJ01004416.1.p1 GENE.GILJ01004416.1~~GILJ01004416.1.p1  ORF type:complete len:408 (-),score=62.38 GILJ01004416.1:52-1275(-)
MLRLLHRAHCAKQFLSVRSAHTATRLSITDWSEEETLLRDSAAKFAQTVIAPRVSEMDEKSKLDPAILSGLFEQGLMGVETPVDFGGVGGSFTQACLVVEELAKIDPAVAVIVDIQNTLINTAIRKFGSAAQQAHYLPRLASDTLASFCLSESGSGSDAFALKTRATKQGSHFVLNGSKQWISNAAEAGLFLIFANAEPEKGYRGITAFMVEKDTPGLEIGKKENKLGIRASSTCEVHFNDLKVPADNIIGEYGKGYKIAIEVLNEGRIGIGAQMVGLAQGAMDATLPYLHQRKQFGQVIADFQGMRYQYAQAMTELEAARLMVYNAARLKDSNQDCVQPAAMAKLYSSQVAERVASKCVEWLGGVGFTKDFPAEKFYRDAKIGAIYEGTSNIQLETIAKNIQKKYK